MRVRAPVLIFLLICLALASGCAGAKGTNPSPRNGFMTASAKPTSPKNLRAQATDKNITLNWDMAA